MMKSVHCKKEVSVLRLFALALTASVITALAMFTGCGDKGTGSGSDDDLLDRFGRPMYALTTIASPDSGGRVERLPDSTRYSQGTEVTVTAIPADGYEFTGWSGASTETTHVIVVAMSDSMTLIANFDLVQADHYTLMVETNDASYGTVTREPNQTSYAGGTEVVVTAIPNPGYRFIGWSAASTDTDTAITITVNSNQRLIANFQIITCTLTVSKEPALDGTVYINNAVSTAITTHNFETLVTVRAEIPGYTFIGWSGASNSTDAAITITMDENKELIANFRLDTYTLTTNAVPENGGTVTRNLDQENYITGTVVTVTATPAEGFAFVGWAGALNSTVNTAAVTMNGDRELTAVFELIPISYYTLGIGLDPVLGGTVTRNPEATSYPGGTQVTVTAEASPGYRFISWQGVSSSTESEVLVTMNSHGMMLTAKFQQMYVLTIDQNPADGGTVTPQSGLSHDVGTQTNITAAAADGYRFVNWTVTSGSAMFANPNNANTTVSSSVNTTIRANFQRMYMLTIESPTVGAAITPVSGLSHDAGAPVAISAAAVTGYRFVNWTVTNGTAVLDNPAGAAATVTMSSDAAIRANYQRIFTLTIDRHPTGGGTVTPAGGLNYDAQMPVDITAAAAGCYRFVNWTVVNGTAVFGNANSAATTVTMSSDAAVRANFERMYTLMINRNLTIGGTVTPESGLCYNAEMPIEITAAPAIGYSFVNWTVTNGTADFADASNAATTVTLSSDAEIRANFELNTYTLAVNLDPTDGSGGTVTRSLNLENYPHGTHVTVTAIPVADYTFARWSGALNSTANPVVIIMDGSKELTAVFDLIPPNHYTLGIEIDPVAGGSVSRSPEASSYAAGTQVTVTAEAADGFMFVSWSGASSSTNPSVAITINNNTNLTANFQRQTHTLTINQSPQGGARTITPNSGLNHNALVPIAITAAAADCYRFVNWTVTSGTAAFNNANSAQTTVTLSSNATISANFERLYTLTIERNPTGGGSFTPASGGCYNAGTPINITAVNAIGYRFTNWTVINGTAVFANANSANTTVTLSSDAAIRANFQRVTYALTINSNPVTGGTFTPASGLSHDSGAVVNIAAVEGSCYRFVNWVVTNGTAQIANVNNAITTVTMSSNATIRANFVRMHTLTIDRNIAAGGTVIPASGQCHSAGPVNITANVANGYRFVNWTLVSGSASFANPNSAATTVTLSENTTIRANFQRIYTLTVNQLPAVGSTLTPASGLTHDAGTPVSINATMVNGYRFVNWTVTSGNATFANSNNANTTVTLSSDATIRANFAQFRTIDTTFTESRTFLLPPRVLFPATVEVYALGGGGGGQGGYSRTGRIDGNNHSGSGGAGGGGAAAYVKFDLYSSVTFDITVGNGGAGGRSRNVDGWTGTWTPGDNGINGDSTTVRWGTNLTLTAGGGVGGSGWSGTGGAGGRHIALPSSFIRADTGHGGNGSSGSMGENAVRRESTGGHAAKITSTPSNSSTVSLFGGGSGAWRPVNENSATRQAAVGGGGASGHSHTSGNNGTARAGSPGGNGLVRIIITYYE